MDRIDGILKKYTNHPKFKHLYQETLSRIFSHKEIRSFIEAHEESIDDTVIENSISKLNEFQREIELYKQGKVGQNPGFMPELYLNENYIDVRYVPTQEFIQQEADRNIKNRLKNQMMPYSVRNASLDQISLDTTERQNIFALMTEFVQGYHQDPLKAQGIYLHGPFGVGKTFILGAFANQLVKSGYTVTMLHFPTFITNLKSTFIDNTTSATIDSVKSVDILIIDDIGAESLTLWSRDEVLTPILEYRMNESLATFFTSNFDFKGLEKHLAHVKEGNNEPVKAKRLMERIKFLAKEVSLTGPNLRQESRGN